MTFTATDFETVTGHPQGACIVGTITNIPGHGVGLQHAGSIRTSRGHFPEIGTRLFGCRLAVRHEAFDRNIRAATMRYCGRSYDELESARMRQIVFDAVKP